MKEFFSSLSKSNSSRRASSVTSSSDNSLMLRSYSASTSWISRQDMSFSSETEKKKFVFVADGFQVSFFIVVVVCVHVCACVCMRACVHACVVGRVCVCVCVRVFWGGEAGFLFGGGGVVFIVQNKFIPWEMQSAFSGLMKIGCSYSPVYSTKKSNYSRAAFPCLFHQTA